MLAFMLKQQKVLFIPFSYINAYRPPLNETRNKSLKTTFRQKISLMSPLFSLVKDREKEKNVVHVCAPRKQREQIVTCSLVII